MGNQDPKEENSTSVSTSNQEEQSSTGSTSAQENTTNTTTSRNLVLKNDRQMLMFTHLSQLLNYITGIGGLIVPIILWQMKKDEITNMDEHGKAIVNFQISLLIYGIVGFILTFIIIGIFILIAVGLVGLIFPIINGIKANDGKPIKYPLSIPFIQ